MTFIIIDFLHTRVFTVTSFQARVTPLSISTRQSLNNKIGNGNVFNVYPLRRGWGGNSIFSPLYIFHYIDLLYIMLLPQIHRIKLDVHSAFSQYILLFVCMRCIYYINAISPFLPYLIVQNWIFLSKIHKKNELFSI